MPSLRLYLSHASIRGAQLPKLHKSKQSKGFLRYTSTLSPKNAKPHTKFIKSGIVTVTASGILALIYFYDNGILLRPSSVNTLPLNTNTFKPFTFVAKEHLSDSLSLFTLRPHAPSTDLVGCVQDVMQRYIWNVEIKQPSLQIARSYTPFPIYSSKDELQLLIRKEPQGEVSSYLHHLPIGATVELRGPHGEFCLPDIVDEVVFIAGGTGIMPAIQVANVLQNRSHTSENGIATHMQVLWANRKREGNPEPGKTKDVTHHDNLETALFKFNSRESFDSSLSRKTIYLSLTTKHFVDEESTFIKRSDILASLETASRRRNRTQNYEPSAGKKLIIISGSDGFIQYLAGQKRTPQGIASRDPIGGLLASVDTEGWEVWKL